MAEFKIIMNDHSWKTRQGEIVAGFGIHYERSKWHVTHLPSGANAGRTRTKADAYEQAKKLAGVEIGGVPLAELPGCEACASTVVLIDRVGQVLGKQPNLDRALRCAAELADALACSKGPTDATA